jgi:hypothetical protein
MRDPLEKYAPGVSFWKIVPQLQDVSPFRQVYDADTTPDKSNSSKVVWWIVRVWQLTHNNLLREKLPEERMADASDALFDDAKWHKKKEIKKVLDGLRPGWDALKTMAQKDLETAREHHAQRNKYLAGLKYGPTTRTEIEQMNAKTPDLLKNIEKLEETVRKEMGEFEEEEDEDESAIESGIL